jgi:hypothetical protein
LVDGTAEYEIDIMFTRVNSLVGGYSKEKVKIDYDELVGKDTVVFHVFDYYPVPQKDKGRAQLAHYLYEGDYNSVLKPTFK